MRGFLVAAWIGLSVSTGCGGNISSHNAAETPAEEATRVFAIAEKLERENKSKEAFNAYRQVTDHFPGTPEAKKASERINKAQRSAGRKKPAK